MATGENAARSNAAHSNVAHPNGAYRTGTASRLRDFAAVATPLGPALVCLLNGRVERRRIEEMKGLGLPVLEGTAAVLPDLQELCDDYALLHPANAFYWQRAREYLAANAQGHAAGLDLAEQWGFVANQQGGVDVPDWWNGRMVLPLEFQDYSPDQYPEAAVHAAGLDPERFRALAQKGSDYAWMGYYQVKGRLLSGGVSLLNKEATDRTAQLVELVGRPSGQPRMVYVMGISEDEVVALGNRGFCVVGFNLGYSPVMAKLIENRRVQPLLAQRDGSGRITGLLDADTQEPFHPEANKCYACQLNVAKDGLPVPEASGVVMTNLTMHHNSFEDQVTIVREIHRAALPLPGGGRAWVATECHRNPDIVRILITLNPHSGATGWDAWASFANGISTIENLVQRQEQLADEGIHLKFRSAPRGLAGAPALVHRLLMPLMQVVVSEYAGF